MPDKKLFVLGAPDPEMEKITQLVQEHGSWVVEAMSNGERVTSRSAYTTDNPTCEDGQVWVECAPAAGFRNKAVIVIDHHRLGDHGYGRPPSEYWEASSLGQVCALLEIEPTTELRIMAAADHCVTHAYKGRCPGVDPEELGIWRAESRAAFRSRKEGRLITAEEVLASVELAADKIRQAPRICVGGEEVADLRIYTGIIPDAPEASARLGIPILGPILEVPSGLKLGILGSEGPAIEAFLRGENPAEELIGLYGDPARGYCGGYYASLH